MYKFHCVDVEYSARLACYLVTVYDGEEFFAEVVVTPKEFHAAANSCIRSHHVEPTSAEGMRWLSSIARNKLMKEIDNE